MENIKKIFGRLKQQNLRIKIDKCKFFGTTTGYLGHILTTEGVKPTPHQNGGNLKIEAAINSKTDKIFI